MSLSKYFQALICTLKESSQISDLHDTSPFYLAQTIIEHELEGSAGLGRARRTRLGQFAEPRPAGTRQAVPEHPVLWEQREQLKHRVPGSRRRVECGRPETCFSRALIVGWALVCWVFSTLLRYNSQVDTVLIFI